MAVRSSDEVEMGVIGLGELMNSRNDSVRSDSGVTARTVRSANSSEYTCPWRSEEEDFLLVRLCIAWPLWEKMPELRLFPPLRRCPSSMLRGLLPATCQLWEFADISGDVNEECFIQTAQRNWKSGRTAANGAAGSLLECEQMCLSIG